VVSLVEGGRRAEGSFGIVEEGSECGREDGREGMLQTSFRRLSLLFRVGAS
jgi:hypothetical protein